MVCVPNLIMDEEAKNYDDLLYPILHHQGNIVDFLDTMFDFLYRRTDFFKIKTAENSSGIGLPFGDAEKLVRNSFCKFFQKAADEQNIRVQQPTADASSPENTIPLREEVVSEETKIPSGQNILNSDTNDDIKSGDVGDKVYQNDPECYNGAKYEKYSWAQSIKDLDVQVKIPDHITKSSQVKVDMKPQYLKVQILEGSDWQTLVEDSLSWKVIVEESAWTLIPRDHIHISLEKTDERWWSSLLETEPKIDVHKIDATKNYEDLDEESRAKIQELMYNEHQKRLGKPTIEQKKMTEVLRQAWNLENSPFKGLPFDPSIIDMAPGSDLSKLPPLK